MRVLVTEQLSDQGLELLRRDFQVDVRTDLAAGPLATEIAPYDALIIRSATRVTDAVLGAATNLKVVARAGIGLDNIDVESATRRGVMVVNAPQSNIISAAEQTLALLLAQARNVPQANADLKAGQWNRSKWEGVELHGKTLVEVLHRMEVNEIEPKEMVDRALHRVVSYEPADFAEDDGRIVMRIKRGFVWRDQVLRPEEVVAKRFSC